MAGILDVAAQRFLGGAGNIAALEARYGEKFILEIQVHRRGVLFPIPNADPTPVGERWALDAPVSFRQAEINPTGQVTSLATSTGADDFTAVISDQEGRIQVAIDTEIFSANPEPEGGSRQTAPCALGRLQLAGGVDNKSHEMIILLILRHGTGTPPADDLDLPTTQPDFEFIWELSGEGTVTPVTQGTIDAIVTIYGGAFAADGSALVLNRRSLGGVNAPDISIPVPAVLRQAGGGASLLTMNAYLATSGLVKSGGNIDPPFGSTNGDFRVVAALTAAAPRLGFDLPAGRQLVGVYEGGVDVTADFTENPAGTYIHNYDLGEGGVDYFIRTRATP